MSVATESISAPTPLATAPAPPNTAAPTRTLATPAAAVRRPARYGPPAMTARATDLSELEDPHPVAQRLARAVVEALGGMRPAAHLSRWLSHDLDQEMRRRCARRSGAPAGTIRPLVLVRRVTVCRPVAEVAECSAVVQCGGRVRAVALRLEATYNGWLVTALQVG
ncbi:MAG: hypothetical protein CSA58_03590, partial [Micrococcales bacterium]